jgi:hypothetical protein
MVDFGMAGVATSFTGRNDVHAGMFRLSYLFNWAGAVVAKY